MARRARCSPPKAGEACAQRGVKNLCRGTVGWRRCGSEQGSCSRPGRVLEKPSARTTEGPAMGKRLEPRNRSPRRLPVDFADDAAMRIGHEATSYRRCSFKVRGALRRELTACLRTGRVLRMPRARTRGRGKGLHLSRDHDQLPPAEPADRAVPGHWEGDLILGLGEFGDRHLGGAYDALHSAAIPAAHGGPWPRGSREEQARIAPVMAPRRVRDAICCTIVTMPEQRLTVADLGSRGTR